MLNKIAINAVVLALSASVVSAAPTPDQDGSAMVFTNGTNSTGPTHGQQWDTSVFRSCLNTSQVALTFDDGPHSYEQDIAGLLAASGSNGTFFLNGNNWDCIYDYVDEIRALHAAGHVLGSHSWSHKHMTALNSQEMNDELERVEEAFIRILGLRPRLFRPPYGEYNDQLLSILKQRGYTGVIIWNQDTQDGSGATVAFSEDIYDHTNGGDIVLGHSVKETTAKNVVPYAIRVLQNKGLELVGIDTCLGGNETFWPYEYVGEPQSGKWQC